MCQNTHIQIAQMLPRLPCWQQIQRPQQILPPGHGNHDDTGGILVPSSCIKIITNKSIEMSPTHTYGGRCGLPITS